MEKISIIGAGSYGTALATKFCKCTDVVNLISNSAQDCEFIKQYKKHPRVLKDIHLSSNITPTCDLSKICDSDIILIAVPGQAIKSVLTNISQLQNLDVSTPVVLCSKSIDIENSTVFSHLAEKIVKNPIVILSGPSFAKEIANNLPAYVNISSRDNKISKKISDKYSTNNFSLSVCDDFIGIQVCGALKNVLAIACGIFTGLNLGNSAISALITAGCIEMVKLTKSMGGTGSAFLNFCGIGDTILTCTSKQSRNMEFGIHLSSGGNLKNWTGYLTEGALSAKAVKNMSKTYNVDLPVFSMIAQAIAQEITVSQFAQTFFNMKLSHNFA